jgi:hypothetical protein
MGKKWYDRIGLGWEMVRQLFIIFFQHFLYDYLKLIRSWPLKTKSFRIYKTLLKTGSANTILFLIVKFNSFLPLSWHFSRIFTKLKLLHAAFQKNSVQIRELYQPIGREEFHFSIFKSVYVN